MTIYINGLEILTEGGLRFTNMAAGPGMTISATAETQFSPKFTIAPGTLVTGTRMSLVQYGTYTSTGLLPSIVPRVRLGGVSLFTDKTITGLLGDTSPWYSIASFLVTGNTISASGFLIIADNQIRLFGGPSVTIPNFNVPLDLTSSAQWGQAGCSITCQAWLASVTPPVLS